MMKVIPTEMNCALQTHAPTLFQGPIFIKSHAIFALQMFHVKKVCGFNVISFFFIENFANLSDSYKKLPKILFDNLEERYNRKTFLLSTNSFQLKKFFYYWIFFTILYTSSLVYIVLSYREFTLHILQKRDIRGRF